MAGVITHMVVAREIIKRLPKDTIREESLFYLGNLAPDAIHAREGYVRAFKKHTHFRDDILDADFERPENRQLFHKRLADFIAKNKDRADGLFDLYLGYAAHVLTDELFMLTVRKEFCEVMEDQGIAQTDPGFFENIVGDMNRNDILLVRDYEDIEEVKEKLLQVTIHPIENYISVQEMKDCMDWMIRRHFYEEDKPEQTVHISYQRILSFIREAAEYVISKLTEAGSPLCMLSE
jgi:hypothetical protein